MLIWYYCSNNPVVFAEEPQIGIDARITDNLKALALCRNCVGGKWPCFGVKYQSLFGKWFHKEWTAAVFKFGDLWLFNNSLSKFQDLVQYFNLVSAISPPCPVSTCLKLLQLIGLNLYLLLLLLSHPWILYITTWINHTSPSNSNKISTGFSLVSSIGI